MERLCPGRSLQAPFTVLKSVVSLVENSARTFNREVPMSRTRAMLAAAGSLLLAASMVVAISQERQAQAKADANPGARDVIVHLFEWPWASIASECTNVLGPKGFGAVQVSPPQEHVVLPG